MLFLTTEIENINMFMAKKAKDNELLSMLNLKRVWFAIKQESIDFTKVLWTCILTFLKCWEIIVSTIEFQIQKYFYDLEKDDDIESSSWMSSSGSSKFYSCIGLLWFAAS